MNRLFTMIVVPMRFFTFRSSKIEKRRHRGMGYLAALCFFLCPILLDPFSVKALAVAGKPAAAPSSRHTMPLIQTADRAKFKNGRMHIETHSARGISYGNKVGSDIGENEKEATNMTPPEDADIIRAIVNPFNATCYDWFGRVMPCHFKGPYAELMFGRPSPVPRFTDNRDGTVTDRFTGLIWLKHANGFGIRDWFQARKLVKSLKDGYCSPEGKWTLLDGSSSGQWRLPTILELAGLIDLSRREPALPRDHMFSNIPGGYCWSSTTLDAHSGLAWVAFIHAGGVCYNEITNRAGHVWPVRDPGK